MDFQTAILEYELGAQKSEKRILSDQEVGMKSLVEFIAKSLVDDPIAVRVLEQPVRGGIRIELTAAEEDMGRIIGRNGRVANAMRQLLRVAASRHGTRCTLDII